MKKTCPQCRTVNFPNAEKCVRCQKLFNADAPDSPNETAAKKPLTFVRRAIFCVLICLLALARFYLSLIFTSKSLTYDEKAVVRDAVGVLERQNFADEVFLLRYLTNFRGNDNWLNASTKYENAYAATNFPVEIMTVYPEFFNDTTDNTERAAILLHEAQHLKGADEKKAYEFVWRNRRQLGWTAERYSNSVVWNNVRRQTAEFAPNLFVCDANPGRDCTE